MDCKEVQNLSADLKAIFEEFHRIILRDPTYPKPVENEQIYRFLKARDFDIKQAEKMLKNHIEWRQKMENTLKNFEINKLQTKYLRFHAVSFTKEGNPFIYVNAGQCDFKGLSKSIKGSDIITCLISDLFNLEKVMDVQSEKLGKRINQWMFAVDLADFNISQVLYKPSIETCMQLLQFYEANFPERLNSAIILNASVVFTIIFNIVKPILTAHTLSKVKIFAADGWKDELLNMINEENLPMFLGGQKTGPNGDPFCNVIKLDGPVPKECYFRSPERRLKGKTNVTEYILKKGEICKIKFDIDEVKSEIGWKFETERGDISFGLFYQNDNHEDTTKEITPLSLVNTHIEMEKGNYLCDRTGIYILWMDNTHSWLNEKHIFCKAYIRKPHGTKIFVTN